MRPHLERTTKDLRPTDLVNNLPIGLMTFRRMDDGRAIVVFANPAFETYGGYPRHAALGLSADQLSGFGAQSRLAECIEAALRTGEPQRIDLPPRDKVNDQHHACTLYPVAGATGELDHVFATILDVTAEKRAEHQLLRAVYRDELTGLPNRALFIDRLEQALAAGRDAAILTLNLDRFQQINESLGHSAGDELLSALALRLMNVVRTGDTLARFSGDEFAILVDAITSVEDALVVAGRVHQELREPFAIGGLELHMTISIGIASTFDCGRHPEDLIRHSDFAMHRAKALGKARSEVYHSDLHGRARNLFQLEGELRRAILEGRLALHYQPLVTLNDGKLVGFEALARWPHPDRGMISPAEFVPIAEETGLVVPLGRWALRCACRQLRAWRDTYGPVADALTMAVNVSSIQFARDNLVDAVTEALVESGLPGAALTLELTESAIVENPERTRQTLQQLKALDVIIAIDDFGTGYSSLAHLQRFPIDKIKLDRSFISQMSESQSNQKLTEAVLMLAHSLEKDVVAEGIETADQRGILDALGCRFGQGFYFSRPVASDAASALVGQAVSGRTLLD